MINNSKAVREVMPEQLPAVHMPACDVRPVLKGQKALITGANSGIGRAVAIALGRAGADVVVNYRAGDEDAQKVCDEITHCDCPTRGRAIAIRADVSDEGQVHAMFETMFREFGTIDVLVA